MTPRSLILTCLPFSLLCALGAPTVASAMQASDWPQWRGPQRDGVSAEVEWSAVGAEGALWRKELGLGHSSFAVAGGRVFTLGYDAEAGLDSVFCLDAVSGEELWRHSYASEIWDVAHTGGTLTTPTVVDDVVYTSNREGKVFCFDVATGAVRWSRDLREDYGLEPPTWGFSASPLVIDERVILNVDLVVTLDRHTGEEVWVSETRYGKAYSTPAPFELAGDSFLAVLSGSGLALLERTTGFEISFFSWPKEPEIYPMTPVVIEDRIFISAGYDRGAAMLQFTDGELVELWSSRVMRNKMTGCVLWEGHLYGFDESILKCIDLDGNQMWRERGMGTGSMTIAGGRLVILDGSGQIIVAQADPGGFHELSRKQVFDGGTAWATPILSDGRIYARSSSGEVACLDYRGKRVVDAASAAGDGELPSADAILSAHIAGMGGADKLAAITSVHLSGTTESLINTVRTGGVDLVWDPTRGFAWSDETGMQFGSNGSVGWVLRPRSEPAVILGGGLDALRQTGDLARLFDPRIGAASFGTVSTTVVEGRPCYSVLSTTASGQGRTLYFEIATGLYAGHEGDDTALWTVGEYREFDGVQLPTQWNSYEPIKGERASATFTSATVNGAPAEELFAIPEAVQPFLRSPEEIELANERLRREHAAVLGNWVPAEGVDGRPMSLNVVDGFLAILPPDGVDDGDGPTYLTEPDESGAMAMLSARFVTFTPERNEAGEPIAIQVRVGGDLDDRLVRPAE